MALHSKREPVRILQEPGWITGPFCKFSENFALTGIPFTERAA